MEAPDTSRAPGLPGAYDFATADRGLGAKLNFRSRAYTMMLALQASICDTQTQSQEYVESRLVLRDLKACPTPC